jgi:thioredoxin 1
MEFAAQRVPDRPPAMRSRRTLLALAGVAGLAAAGLGIALQGRVGIAPATNPTHATPLEDPVELALRQGRPMVIQFGANACAACREMKPVLQALQQAHGARFTVMNVDLIAQKHRGYLQRFRIQLMPTQVFFDATGRETHRNMGTITAAAMLARLEGSSS